MRSPTQELEEWRSAPDDDWRYHCILRVFMPFVNGKRPPFPSPHYTWEEAEKELERVRRSSGSLDVGKNAGTSLATSYFPHFFHVPKKPGCLSAIDAWNDDEAIKRAIEDCFRADEAPTLERIRARLRFSSEAGEITNFRVMAAKYLYERYAPQGGCVLDPSAGWGARQIAARSLGLTYTGLEPYSKTYQCGIKLAADLDKVYGGRTELVQQGSEDYCPDGMQGAFDFAFTSPPYFDVEPYSTEETQSHVKFPDLAGWYAGFVYGTARNVFALLKPEAICGVNVAADFRASFRRCYEQAGFEYVEELGYGLTSVPGRGAPGVKRTEPILMFRKPT